MSDGGRKWFLGQDATTHITDVLKAYHSATYGESEQFLLDPMENSFVVSDCPPTGPTCFKIRCAGRSEDLVAKAIQTHNKQCVPLRQPRIDPARVTEEQLKTLYSIVVVQRLDKGTPDSPKCPTRTQPCCLTDSKYGWCPAQYM